MEELKKKHKNFNKTNDEPKITIKIKNKNIEKYRKTEKYKEKNKEKSEFLL